MTAETAVPASRAAPGWSGSDDCLRHADWRYLLPLPAVGPLRHLILLGGSAALADRLTELGCAEVVSRELPSARTADAVVVLSEARLPVEAAAEALTPGGALYYEVDRTKHRSRRLTPRGIRRALRRCGLVPTGLYWVRPSFAVRKLYLPLDVPGALRWYLRTTLPAATPKEWLTATLLRASSRLGTVAVAEFVPRFAVTAVACTATQVPGGPAILALPELPSQVSRPNSRPVIVTNGRDELDRVIVLPFSPDRERPDAVLKLSRVPGRNVLCDTEQAALYRLREHLGDGLHRGLPEPLGSTRWGGISVTVESYLPGRVLSASSGDWHRLLRQKTTDFQVAVAWLTEFNLQAQISASPWSEAEIQRWVEAPLARYREAFGVTPPESRLFTEIERLAQGLAGAHIPILWQHYAFAPWNLCRDGDALGVFDWEGAEPGLPLFDFLYFTFHWHNAVSGLRNRLAQLRGFQQLFGSVPGESISEMMDSAIARYLRRLEIPAAYAPIPLVVLWVLHAISRFDRHQTLEITRGDPRTGNPYIDYVRILAEHPQRVLELGTPRGGDA
jgi:hypothetical protein